MNKKYLILPIILSLTIVGCSKKKNANKKGDVVNDVVLKANTSEIRKNIFSNYSLSNIDLSAYTIDNISYSNGFIIVNGTKNAVQFHGIYSAIEGIFVYSSSNSFTYQTYASSITGGFVRIIDGSGKTTVIDGVGNVLVSETSQAYLSASITSGINNSGAYYADVRFDTYRQYFVYNSEGVAKLHASSEGEDFDPGSPIPGMNYVKLDEYGHPGYQRISNSSRYIIFDDKGNEISSFSDPQADVEFFVGDYMIYQNSVKLDNNNDNYDYINGAGERFSLETYKINYLTAKKESIDVKYVLSVGEEVKPFFSEKKVYSYVYANLKTISDKKILNSATETYIIDSSANLHDNVTGIDLGSFERFGSNYYNTYSKTIYDGNLNELSILADMNPVKCDNGDIIVCEMEGKYGAINPNGKVVIPFILSNVYTNYVSDNALLGVYDGKLSLVKFNSESCTYRIEKVYDGISTVNYLYDDGGTGCGGGIYRLSGSATSGQAYPSYFSLAGDAYQNINLDSTADMSTYMSVAHVINKARFTVLETKSSVFSSLRGSYITISR